MFDTENRASSACERSTRPSQGGPRRADAHRRVFFARRRIRGLQLILRVNPRISATGALAYCGGVRLEGSPCGPTGASDAADLVLDVTELGAAYLGGTPLGALAAAGLVTEGRPGAVRQLSAALFWDLAPWCPVNF